MTRLELGAILKFRLLLENPSEKPITNLVKTTDRIMRTAIFMGAILIADAINPNIQHSEQALGVISSIALGSAIMDIVDFLRSLNQKK